MSGQINLTVYSVTGNSEKIPNLLAQSFGNIGKQIQCEAAASKFQCQITLLDDTVLNVSINTDESFIPQHLEGMAGFYSQADMQDEELQEKILMQIFLFNCLVGFTFEQTEEDNRTNAIINSVFAFADSMEGFVFMADGRLMNGEGKKLIAPDGSTDYKEFNPIASSDFIDSPEPMQPADEERRQRSITRLKAAGIPYMEGLPVPMLQHEATPRTVQEIAQRSVALFGVCVYSESLCSDETVEAARNYIAGVNEKYDIFNSLTIKERDYIADNEPEKGTCINYSWQYECCVVLLWSLGLMDMNEPTSICDVKGISEKIFNLGSMENFINQCRPLDFNKILDEADYILRCDWACVDARVKGEGDPAGLIPGVVLERHRALNWLIGTADDWDDVRMDT